MKRHLYPIGVLLAALPVLSATALDNSVAHVNGDDSRTLLGDGTGVIVGIIDSGVDDTHPALTGLDSLGNNRLVAEANFVTSEPGNTGDDIFGHGTWVASVVLGEDPAEVAIYNGLATDARYINARVLNSTNGFASTTQVENGVAFAVNNGANLLNLSLNFFAADSNTGTFQLDYMLDYIAKANGVASVISAGNIGQAQGGDPNVRSPAGAFNVLSVGRTDADFDQIHPDSAIGLTTDGRSKPDLSAPGTSITMANDDWETQADWNTASGTSFAAPHVAGLLTQQFDYGITNALSTNPLVTKATLLNSAQKNVLDKAGNAWEPFASSVGGGVLSVTAPLDNHSGAGQIDGESLFDQYSPGEQGPGLVNVEAWDLNAITDGAEISYTLDEDVAAGTLFSATLTWFRDIGRTDLGDAGLDSADNFFLNSALDNLDLEVYRNGVLIAESVSAVDNLEHLSFLTPGQGTYTIRVVGSDVVGDASEGFALAWSAVAVPEPTSFAMLGLSGLLLAGRRRR